METKNFASQKIIVSKSAKRKMSSIANQKADGYTREVVYKTYLGRGRFSSITKHEKI